MEEVRNGTSSRKPCRHTNTSLDNRGGAFTVPDGKGSSDPKVAKGVEALKKEATSVHHLMTQELCLLPQRAHDAI